METEEEARGLRRDLSPEEQAEVNGVLMALQRAKELTAAAVANVRHAAEDKDSAERLRQRADEAEQSALRFADLAFNDLNSATALHDSAKRHLAILLARPPQPQAPVQPPAQTPPPLRQSLPVLPVDESVRGLVEELIGAIEDPPEEPHAEKEVEEDEEEGLEDVPALETQNTNVGAMLDELYDTADLTDVQKEEMDATGMEVLDETAEATGDAEELGGWEMDLSEEPLDETEISGDGSVYPALAATSSVASQHSSPGLSPIHRSEPAQSDSEDSEDVALRELEAACRGSVEEPIQTEPLGQPSKRRSPRKRLNEPEKDPDGMSDEEEEDLDADLAETEPGKALRVGLERLPDLSLSELRRMFREASANDDLDGASDTEIWDLVEQGDVEDGSKEPQPDVQAEMPDEEEVEDEEGEDEGTQSDSSESGADLAQRRKSANLPRCYTSDPEDDDWESSTKKKRKSRKKRVESSSEGEDSFDEAKELRKGLEASSDEEDEPSPKMPKLEAEEPQGSVAASPSVASSAGGGTRWRGRRRKGARDTRARRVWEDNQLDVETVRAKREELYRMSRQKRRDEALAANGRELLVKATDKDSAFDRVILDMEPGTGEVRVEVPRGLAKLLRQHQGEGVRFLYDNVIESLERFRAGKDSGGGILAHCMGLGKTLQTLVFLQTVMGHPVLGQGDKDGKPLKTALILAPKNAILVWEKEIRKWLSKSKPKLNSFVIESSLKLPAKMAVVKEWAREGGLLVLSYDQLKLLCAAVYDPIDEVRKRHKRSKSKKAKAESTEEASEAQEDDGESDELYSPEELVEMRKTKERAVKVLAPALFSPGPSIVVCDEGHLLKNPDTAVTQAVMTMECPRRVCLSGTPIQNNLKEYYTLVSWVKPSLLGSEKEFYNGFGNPIKGMQTTDCSEEDRQFGKNRLAILTHNLRGVLHRRGEDVAAQHLPPRHEVVLYVTPSARQDDMLTDFIFQQIGVQDMDAHEAKIALKGRVLTDYHVFNAISAHPASLAQKAEDRHLWASADRHALSDIGDLRQSSKLLLLHAILRHSQAVKDKVVVFSQYVTTLSVIKATLSKEEGWEKGKDFEVLEGSCSEQRRRKMQEEFNKRKSRLRLLLVSTRAGGVGVDLVGANRAVLFDSNWNPTNDAQAMYRIYRFGQTKPCFLYRLVTGSNSMEEVVMRKQIIKESIGVQVVDKRNNAPSYAAMDLREYYNYQSAAVVEGEGLGAHLAELGCVAEDSVMRAVLAEEGGRVRRWERRDTLLEHRKEHEISDADKAAAVQDFELQQYRDAIHSGDKFPDWFNVVRTSLVKSFGAGPSASYFLNLKALLDFAEDTVGPAVDAKVGRGKEDFLAAQEELSSLADRLRTGMPGAGPEMGRLCEDLADDLYNDVRRLARSLKSQRVNDAFKLLKCVPCFPRFPAPAPVWAPASQPNYAPEAEAFPAPASQPLPPQRASPFYTSRFARILNALTQNH